ncbi:translation initiation factor IF-2-like [Daphnia magna]|uniref:translation initiation factor IF-2-like n=1 Tax=Daphnia magna TaxID=35525 RepID=UPI001403CC9E|nr:translation initiation factor IF-2-like [Daphnia magna]
MASGDSQELDYFTEKMESDDDRIDIILSQMPLLENEEVEVAVFETIMEKEDDEVSHVSEGEMMESVGKIEEEGGKGSPGHERQKKKEQRSTEEERREASRGEDESAIEIGNVDEEAENVTEKELLEKKRIIDREKREIEQKLREIKEKRNVDNKKKKGCGIAAVSKVS